MTQPDSNLNYTCPNTKQRFKQTTWHSLIQTWTTLGQIPNQDLKQTTWHRSIQTWPTFGLITNQIVK